MYKEYIEKYKTEIWKPKSVPTNVNESDWPYSFIDFDQDFNKFLEEIKTIPDKYWISHRQNDTSSGYKHEGWSAAVLRGVDYTKTEYHSRYGFNTYEDANYNWTEVNDFTPTLTHFLKELKWNRFERVRIMRLAPQGFIMPHTDGNTRMFGPFNIAINNPDNCNFVMKKYGLVPHQKGRGIFLDVGNEHCIYNDSNDHRYHIIVHGHLNTNLLSKSTQYTYGHTKNQT